MRQGLSVVIGAVGTGEDRRLKYSLTYFSSGGKERRDHGERRKRIERRKGYIRITAWTSVGPFADDE